MSPIVQKSLMINGNVVVSSDAAVSFLSKALSIPVEQIPVTVDPDTEF